MKKTKKLIRNLAFFIILILITFYIFFQNQNIGEIFEIIKTAKKGYVIIAIICMCCFLSCEAMNIGRTLKNLNEKSSFLKNVKYALIGFFFSSITPAASGGQPMQIYYMHKDNIPVTKSTLALLINLTCMQIVTISLGILGAIVNFGYMNSPMKGLFVLGITLNSIALTLLLVSIFSKEATNKLIELSIKILKFFKVKNMEEKQKKIVDALMKYQDNAEYLKEHKSEVMKNVIIAYIQYIAYYSISYFTYKAFGLNEQNIIKIILLQALLYGTVSGIPSPGAVGVSEGGYMSLFEHIYTQNLLSSSMLLSRGISFYLFVAISAIVVIINDLREKKQENVT